MSPAFCRRFLDSQTQGDEPMQKLVPLNKIKPNPHRRMEIYPIDEDKVEALIGSFARTGYWGNIVGRERNGCVQIAYGHHRRESMLRTMKKTDKIEIIIKEIDDAEMLRMMADENMEEWQTNSIIEQETIRAVVQAYAEGKIELEKPAALESDSPKARATGIRVAPSFRQTALCFKDLKTQTHLKPYNAESVARFLGWMCGDQVSPRVRNALLVLEKAEELAAAEEIYEMTQGLRSQQAKAVVQELGRVKRLQEDSGVSEANAKAMAMKAGKSIASQLRSQDMGLRDVREQADKFVPKQPAKLPNFDQFTEVVCDQLRRVLTEDKIHDKVQEVLKHKAYLKPPLQKLIIKALRQLASRCEATASKFEASTVGTKAHLLEE
jgi:hypothetical protein